MSITRKKIKTLEEVKQMFSYSEIEMISEEDLFGCYLLCSEKRTFVKYIRGLKGHHNVVSNFERYLEYRKTPSIDYPGPSRGLYDTQYVALRHNITPTQAEELIKLRKADKATSKQKFIERHGETEGLKKFAKFQETSLRPHQERRASSSKEEELEFQRRNSRRCAEFYLSRGLATTLDEANRCVSEYQLNTAGVNIEYYLSLGLPIEEASEIIAMINLRKDIYKRWKETLTPCEFKSRVQERHDKYRRTINSLSNQSLLEEFQTYANEVWKFTKLNLMLHSDKVTDIDKRGRKHDMSLDHVYSIKQGFIDDVDPEIIGHWTNLAVVDNSYNCAKQARCDKDLNQLLEDYARGTKNED